MFGKNIAFFGGNVSTASAFDPDAEAYINQVLTVGGTLTDDEKTAVNQLTLDVKAAGIWDKFDILMPILGGNANSSKINLVEPTNTNTDWDYLGSPSFSSTGIKGNGTDAAVRSIWKINNLAKAKNNDAHTALYSKYFAGGNTAIRINGTLDTSAGYIKMMASQAGSSYGGMYTENFLNQWNPGASAFEGMMYADTNGTNQKFYYQNTLRGDRSNTPGTFTNNSGLALFSVYWFDYSASRVYDERHPDEIRLFSIGAKLTDSEKDLYYTAVVNYQTTLGRQI